MKLCVCLLLLLHFLCFSHIRAENNRTFPEGFLIGVSTSAYQVEGAWNRDGKGENIWDRWIHTDPSRIKNNDTADDATKFYQGLIYVQDVVYAARLGATHFQFSISWSRILPTGMDTSVNVKGIMYYQDLIRYIREYNMTPIATLYYYDLPQPLQDIGGWTNPEMVKYFVQYAKVAFQYFDNVEYWITFNDPRVICRLGYGEGVYAPGIALDGIGDYLCSYVVLKAHAAAYHLYKEKFPGLKGRVSLAIQMEWSEPASSSLDDAVAAERRNLFEFGMYGHPIFIGNWPQVVIERVGNRSEHENFKKSRLPEFTQEEIEYIKGTADFLAVNIYSTRLVSDIEEPAYDDPSYMKDMKADVSLDPDWPLGADGNAIVPWGARAALKWLKLTYNDPEIFITENGVSDDGGWVDYIRTTFLTDYLLAILDAMYEDNVRVFGYTIRSFVDSFEWIDGYSQHFGLCRVNISSSSKSRWPKRSLDLFIELALNHHVPGETTTIETTTPPTSTTTEGAASRIVLHPSLILFVAYITVLLL